MPKKLSSEELMERALNEAKKTNTHLTHPNPRVGCCIQTQKGNVYVAAHQKSGEAHAEVLAIQKAKEAGDTLENAIVAVTLEPCSHYGKTPPCADLLIEESVSTVIVGVRDPHPEVNGRGIDKLNAAGIEVVLGTKEYECTKFNKEWLFAHNYQRPYVYLKLATSLDGKWKTSLGEDRWVTSEAARTHSHELREKVQGLMVSSKTIEEDNPSLTARSNDGEFLPFQPQVYVASQRAKERDYSNMKIAQHPKGFKLVDGTDLKTAFERMFLEDKVYSLLIECGPKLAHHLLERKLIDELWHYMELSYFGQSNYSFQTPLGEGKLPGLKLELLEMLNFGKNTILLKLLMPR